MTIGIDISRANKKERTGVEWYSYFLIREFKKIVPQDTRVVLYMQNEPMADLLPLPPNWEIKILRWPFRFWTIFRLSWEMLAHKPDIFFSPANIIPFFTPKKTFTTIHDIGFKRFPECYSANERWLHDWGVRRAVKKLNTPLRSPHFARRASRGRPSFAGQAIFVPSEFTKKELIEVYNVDDKKIVVTLLGCNPPSPPNSPFPLRPSSAQGSGRAQQGFPRRSLSYAGQVAGQAGRGRIDGPYFLFIGRKDAKKNITGIIHAFKIFRENNPSYSLILAGPSGYEWDWIPASAGMTKMIGWINSEEKWILLQNAEAFIFPSLYEGFGLPILEAFAAGTPVITSNCASMPEVAGGAAILVDPKNPQEIANAMEKIIKNPAFKVELVERGVERLKNFSWAKCAEKTLWALLGRQN